MLREGRLLFVCLFAFILFCGVASAEFIVRKLTVKDGTHKWNLETLDILEGDFSMNMGCRMDTGAVDVVFAIDSTGSMGSQIAGVRSTISAFADSMEAAGFDWAFGGVTFGDGQNIWDFDLVNPGYDLTSDLSAFRVKLNACGASGGADGPETSMDAIYDAITQYNWRPHAVHIVIMFTDITFCTTDYPSGGGCCCDGATRVSIADVFDAAITSGTIVYNLTTSWVTGYPLEVYRALSDSTHGAHYDLSVGWATIFNDVVRHLGEYRSIYVELTNASTEHVDSIVAEIFPGRCISPLTSLRKVYRDIDPGERFFIGWPFNADTLCGGGDRCFTIVLTGSDGFCDTIFGCTTTRDCQCIGPEGYIMSPTPARVITACSNQGILWNIRGAFDDVGLDGRTLEVMINDTRYEIEDPELAMADTLISFNPSTPWSNNDRINFCVAAVADLNGCPMNDPICSEFLVDLQPPVVVSVFPGTDSIFFTDDFRVQIRIADSLAGINLSTSYITIDGIAHYFGSDHVTYSGDATGGVITIEGSAVTDFGWSQIDTANICFHGADLVLADFCGPNDSIYCFTWEILLLTQYVWFGEHQAAPCDTVMIPLWIDSILVSQISSVSFDLSFNPDVLVPINVIFNESYTTGWTGIPSIDPATGTLSIDMTGSVIPPSPPGILCWIRAVVPCTASGGDFSSLAITDLEFNRGFPMDSTKNGFFIATWNIDTWIMDIRLNRTDNSLENQFLAIGAGVHTSDLYEAGSDLPILPPLPGRFDAWLSLNDPAYPHIDKLRRDLRGITLPVRWVIHTAEPIVSGISESYAVWNPGRLPEGVFMINNLVNMKNDTIFHYNIGDSLVITWTQPDFGTTDFSLCMGWNMISLPTVPPTHPPSYVFPSTPVPLFQYDAQRRIYGAVERFNAGFGYWIYSPESGNTTVGGVILDSYNLRIYRGWNLIGTIGEPVAVSSITTDVPGAILPPVYGYNCVTRTYTETDTLYPGYGYWLMSHETAVLSVPGMVGMRREIRNNDKPEWMGQVKFLTMFLYSDIVLPPQLP